MHIRSFTADDYSTLVDFLNRVYVSAPVEESWLRFNDQIRKPARALSRYLVESDGQLIAEFRYSHSNHNDDPHRLFFRITTAPEWRGRGFGAQFYEQILSEIKPWDPKTLRSKTFSDQPDGIRFLEKRGFVEEMRYLKSSLDLIRFDSTRWRETEQHITAQGLEIMSERSLLDRLSLDEHIRRLHPLIMEIWADIPSPDPESLLTLEEYAERYRLRPKNKEATFIAVDPKTDTYVGFSSLHTRPDPSEMGTALTGVGRKWRRCGVALALKVHALLWAKEKGILWVMTENESNNIKMLEINKHLGFQTQSTELDYTLHLS